VKISALFDNAIIDSCPPSIGGLNSQHLLDALRPNFISAVVKC